MRSDPIAAIQTRTGLGAKCFLGSVVRPVRPVQTRLHGSTGAPILLPTTTQRRAFQTLLCGVVSWSESDPFMLIFFKRDGSEAMVMMVAKALSLGWGAVRKVWGHGLPTVGCFVNTDAWKIQTRFYCNPARPQTQSR